MAGVGLMSVPAGAGDHPAFDIPLETVERGDEGTERPLATEPVDDREIGWECEVAAEGANNSSVHPDTDLIVRSGDSEVEVLDVERAPDVTTEATGTLILGEEISVSLRFGPDKVFSGGLVVALDCPTPPAPTTTVPMETTTTVPDEATPHAPPAQPVVAEPDFTG